MSNDATAKAEAAKRRRKFFRAFMGKEYSCFAKDMPCALTHGFRFYEVEEFCVVLATLSEEVCRSTIRAPFNSKRLSRQT